MRILMVGLSDSGKTTFLAALYELVRAEPPVEGALHQYKEPAERDYFHEIAQTWLKLKRLGHSNADEPRHGALHLEAPGGKRFDLEIPDISGEDFNHAWEGDPWPGPVVEIAARANAVLIFVRRDEIEPPLLLPSEDAPVPDEKAGSEWSAKAAPTQTKLADLLESLDALVPLPLPIALIASAWDAAEEEAEIRPDQWLKLRLPLLWQMLESRRETRPFFVFGVSAQGGDVEDPNELERLAKITPPHDRVIVAHGEDISADISAPISWLLTQVQ